jgi:hypothetical protein
MDTFDTSVFDAIEKRIRLTEEIHGDTKRLWKFALPRMCGASTWMAKYANKLTDEGLNVLYIECRPYIMEGYGISEKVTVMPKSGGYQFWLQKVIHREKPFDWIICDNLGHSNPDKWFVSTMKIGAQKAVLWIDTVEGELIKFVD